MQLDKGNKQKPITPKFILAYVAFALCRMINTSTNRTEFEIPKVIDVANDRGQPDYVINNTERRKSMKLREEDNEKVCSTTF